MNVGPRTCPHKQTDQFNIHVEAKGRTLVSTDAPKFVQKEDKYPPVWSRRRPTTASHIVAARTNMCLFVNVPLMLSIRWTIWTVDANVYFV